MRLKRNIDRFQQDLPKKIDEIKGTGLFDEISGSVPGLDYLREEVALTHSTRTQVQSLELESRMQEAKRVIHDAHFPSVSENIAKYVEKVIRFETIQSLEHQQKSQTLKQQESGLLSAGNIRAFFKAIGNFFLGLFGFFRSRKPTSEVSGQNSLIFDAPKKKDLKKITQNPEQAQKTIAALKQVAQNSSLRYVRLRLADIWTTLEQLLEPEKSVPEFLDLKAGQFVAIVGRQKTHHLGEEIPSIYTAAEGLMTSLERRSDIHLGIITSEDPLLISEMSNSRMITYPVKQIFEDHRGPYRVTSFQMGDYDSEKAASYVLDHVEKKTKFDHLFGAGSNAASVGFGPKLARTLRFASRIFGGAEKRVTCSEVCSYALDVAKGNKIDPQNAAPNATYFATKLGVDKSIVLDEDFVWNA